MLKKIKNHSLLLYLLISVYFMDTIFRYATVQSFALMDTLISFIFILTFVSGIYLISGFVKSTAQYIVVNILLSVVAFIYASQIVYYRFFKTYYSMYSVGNTEQALDFWRDIMTYIGQNAHWIVLIFLPVFVLLFFGKAYFSFQKTTWLFKCVLIGSMIVIQLSGIGIIHAGSHDQHAAYDLYYHSNYPELSTQKLGLLTTMRLDLQRLLTDWSPTLTAPAPVHKPTEPESDPPDDENHEGEASEDPENNDSTKDETNSESEEKSDEASSTETEAEESEYNVLDIDFDTLIEEASDDTMKQMHTYFANAEPTEKNEYTGKYEGYNLILLTAEGFSPFAVHEDVTPTLYKMVHEGYQFENFYTPIWETSTSDGEYVALNSLLPKSGVWSFEQSANNDVPFVMGNQLKKLDYKTHAYHNHTYTYYGRDASHPNMGYDYKGLGNGLDVTETWPESDLEMMELTVDEYIDDEPFHAYYMTVSGHMQYSFTGNQMAHKNKQHVQDLDYSEQAQAYLATQVELDRALQYLLEQLEAAGVADNTLIAMSADHYPYGLDDATIDEFAGHEVEQNFELYKNTFILYTPDMEPEVITKPASSLDILPTLSNLLGLEYDSRLLMGRDIFSSAAPVIPFLNKSFITDKGFYNSETKQFTPIDGETVDDDYIEMISNIVDEQFYYSAKILETNYYSEIQ